MQQVIAELKNAYRNSAEGQKSCMVCLVCIRNARKIIDSEITIRELLEYSEVPIHYRKEVSIYELLYDYDNDKWYGDTIHGLKEYEEWQKNYGTLVESIGATYAYAVPYHY